MMPLFRPAGQVISHCPGCLCSLKTAHLHHLLNIYVNLYILYDLSHLGLDMSRQEAWGHIPDCMITLFTMTTLSDWSEQVRRVAVYDSLNTLMPVFTILFLAICSLGGS